MYHQIKIDLLEKEFIKIIDLKPDLPELSKLYSFIDYKKGIKKYKTVITERDITELKKHT